MVSDTKLIARAKSRYGDIMERPHRHGPNAYSCPYCGRYWEVQPVNGVSCSGFIMASATSHVFTCSTALPEERRAIARHDEKRWARNKPANTIRNNHNHAGYRDTKPA